VARRRIRLSPSRAAEGNHPDVEIVAHAVGLRAGGNERVKRLVEDISHEIGLRAAGLGDFVHRSGLIDDEEKAGRILSADFSLVSHGITPISLDQRSAATAGRVPMSKKSAMASIPALNTNPRAPGRTSQPLLAGAATACGGRKLDMRNSDLPKRSLRTRSSFGKINGSPSPASTWRLNKRQPPSSVARPLSRSAIGSGLPSEGWPSV